MSLTEKSITIDFFFSLVPLETSNPILHSVFPGAGQHLPDLFSASQTTPEHPACITAQSGECICTGSPLFFVDLGPGGKTPWRLKLTLFHLYEKEIILIFNMNARPSCRSDCSCGADGCVLMDGSNPFNSRWGGWHTDTLQRRAGNAACAGM